MGSALSPACLPISHPFVCRLHGPLVQLTPGLPWTGLAARPEPKSASPLINKQWLCNRISIKNVTRLATCPARRLLQLEMQLQEANLPPESSLEMRYASLFIRHAPSRPIPAMGRSMEGTRESRQDRRLYNAEINRLGVGGGGASASHLSGHRNLLTLRIRPLGSALLKGWSSLRPWLEETFRIKDYRRAD